MAWLDHSVMVVRHNSNAGLKGLQSDVCLFTTWSPGAIYNSGRKGLQGIQRKAHKSRLHTLHLTVIYRNTRSSQSKATGNNPGRSVPGEGSTR